MSSPEQQKPSPQFVSFRCLGNNGTPHPTTPFNTSASVMLMAINGTVHELSAFETAQELGKAEATLLNKKIPTAEELDHFLALQDGLQNLLRDDFFRNKGQSESIDAWYALFGAIDSNRLHQAMTNLPHPKPAGF